MKGRDKMSNLKWNCSLVDFITVLHYTSNKKVNEHGHAKICGYIRKEEEETLLYKNGGNTFCKIELEEEEKNTTLFAGLVKAIRIDKQGDVRKAEITLTGGTKLLEGVERTRTFQNKAMTYEQILQAIEKNYEYPMHLMKVGKGAAIGDMIVQYKETDWTFLKRLASHFHSGILPYYKDTGIKYSFGLEAGVCVPLLEIRTSSMWYDQEEFYQKTRQQVNILYEDEIYFQVTSKEFFDLGEGVQLDGQSLYVYSVESKFVEGEVLHTYYLKRVGGFQFPKQYNGKIVGASLDAAILSVAGDRVKVCVSVDGMQDSSAAKWFPYSTVYSSPDGTGWYCMPEVKDKVRLYFPNEKEEEGYIISSIHQEVEGGSAASSSRSNPDHKSISTKYNKQIELTPTSIMITNNKGMRVTLDDEEGIQIVSDKDVLIQSDQKLSIKSQQETMSVEALEAIELIQGDSKIELREDVTISGAKFKLE